MLWLYNFNYYGIIHCKVLLKVAGDNEEIDKFIKKVRHVVI